MFFRCRYTQARMTAYLNGELLPKARRRVTRHLDVCSTCSAYYVREREVKRDLERHVRLVGQPQGPQLQKLWMAIQQEINPPAAQRRTNPASYGFAALVLILMLLVPATLGNRNVPFSLEPRPAPALAVTGTPKTGGTQSATTIALKLTGESDATPNLALQNTPEASK
jgi:anti-sigma factor RsiW